MGDEVSARAVVYTNADREALGSEAVECARHMSGPCVSRRRASGFLCVGVATSPPTALGGDTASDGVSTHWISALEALNA